MNSKSLSTLARAWRSIVLGVVTLAFVSGCGRQEATFGTERSSGVQQSADLKAKPRPERREAKAQGAPPAIRDVDSSELSSGGLPPKPAANEDDAAAPIPAPSSAPDTPQNPLPVPTPFPTITPQCAGIASTVATLETSTFVNNAQGQWVTYRLSQKDCNGNAVAITADEIRFDVDANFGMSSMESVPFRIYLSSDTSQALGQGRLKMLRGQDMFGVSGPNRWYYTTSNQVVIPASTFEVYFTVDMSCQVIHPWGSGFPYPAEESLDSYLAFGPITPVKKPMTIDNSQLFGACR